MRLLVLVAALGLVRAPAVRADAILYATEATTNKVDGFCLHADGSLAPTPTTQVDTAGVQPRRLVVGANHALYVAETDRVEVFQIGTHGGLKLKGATPTLNKPNQNALDVALSPDATKLYVPENGRDRLVAYPLDANGAPAAPFTSCIKGVAAPRYQRLVVANGLLYVTATSDGGKIQVFPLAADGSLPEDPSACEKRKSTTPPTCPCSERRRLDDPRALIVDGDMVFVESLLKKRILQFTLGDAGTNQTSGSPNLQKNCPLIAPHQFQPPFRKKTGQIEPVCLKDESTAKALTGAFRWQKWTSATMITLQYQDVVRVGDTLLGSQFFKARIDAFRLKVDGTLPHALSGSTTANVRGSPVGLAARSNVLYVGAGEFDRVQAFRIGKNSGLPEPTPFSQTDTLTNSFPNAVAIADLGAEDCL